jgi:hypothetical protein
VQECLLYFLNSIKPKYALTPQVNSSELRD